MRMLAAYQCAKDALPADIRIGACKILDTTGGMGSGTFPNYLAWLGDQYRREQHYSASIAAYSEAFKLQQSPVLLDRRADVHVLNGEFDLAVADEDAAVGIANRSASALNGRCWMRAIAGRQLDVALADCNAAVGLAPGDQNIWDSRGFVRFRMADYAGAIADMNAALAIDPKMASSLYVRGLAKSKTGDAAGGDADVAAAKALDPNVADTYAGYAVAP